MLYDMCSTNVNGSKALLDAQLGEYHKMDSKLLETKPGVIFLRPQFKDAELCLEEFQHSK